MFPHTLIRPPPLPDATPPFPSMCLVVFLSCLTHMHPFSLSLSLFHIIRGIMAPCFSLDVPVHHLCCYTVCLSVFLSVWYSSPSVTNFPFYLSLCVISPICLCPALISACQSACQSHIFRELLRVILLPSHLLLVSLFSLASLYLVLSPLCNYSPDLTLSYPFLSNSVPSPVACTTSALFPTLTRPTVTFPRLASACPYVCMCVHCMI